MAVDKSGVGIGSALVALIFTVLCLAFFALISYTAAGNDMKLAKAEAAAVVGYYEADALAEQIAAEIFETGATFDNLLGVDIKYSSDSDFSAVAEFCVATSERQELYVKIALKEGNCDVLVWRLRDSGEWTPDRSMPVWQGS